ncbi:unnamed protein product [Gongylonema pulchrum]|uniref:SH3 domain-containing protein n=1 Tax=Gongylonema pulchrum TaxID=637853 RepID=A0A183EUL5_9BILA|nr:unnamed protein product [Gongylonema pulchrum]
MKFPTGEQRKNTSSATSAHHSDDKRNDDSEASVVQKTTSLQPGNSMKHLSNETSCTGSTEKRQPVKREDNDFGVSILPVKVDQSEEVQVAVEKRCAATNITYSRSVLGRKLLLDNENEDEDEMRRITIVKRRDNDGWWFTRKHQNGTQANGEERMNGEIRPAIERSHSGAGDGPAVAKVYN